MARTAAALQLDLGYTVHGLIVSCRRDETAEPVGGPLVALVRGCVTLQEAGMPGGLG